MDKEYFRKPNDDEYIYLLVEFDNFMNKKSYYYLTQYYNYVLLGDFVEVPVTKRNYYNSNNFYNKNTDKVIGKVISKRIYTKENAPYPVEKTKSIIRVVKHIPRELGVKDLNSYETLEKISQIENIDDKIQEYVIRKHLGKSKEEYNNDTQYNEEKLRVEEMFSHRYMGFCHIYWRYKKSFLKEDYNIDWLTPSECNPDVYFD